MFNGWSVLRKKLKGEIYKSAKLMPRESDPDVQGQAGDMDNGDDDAALHYPIKTIDKQCFSTLLTRAQDIKEWFDTAQPYSVPISGRMSSAAVINSTMLGIFAAINARGGVLANAKEVPQ